MVLLNILPSVGIAGGLGITGILMAAWGTVKMYLTKIYSIFVIRINLSNKNIRGPVRQLLLEEFKRQDMLSLRTYMGNRMFIKSLDKKRLVGFKELPQEPTIFWRNKRPMLVSWNNGEKSGSSSSFNISFLRWTFDADELIREALAKSNSLSENYTSEQNRFWIEKYFGTLSSGKEPISGKSVSLADEESSKEPNSEDGCIPLDYDWDDLGAKKSKSPFSCLSLDDNCQKALEEARLWKKSEEWYKERNIPWKRGWLLYGPPGTGKTSFTRALGVDMNMPIYSFDLSTMTSQDFTRCWSNMNRPCIALLEDIDTVFNGRKNIIDQKRGLSFECLLNAIDGVDNTDGVFLIVTTNDVDKIDPAIGVQVENTGMSSRPGRIDRTLLMSSPDENGRRKIAERILDEFPEYINEIVDEGKGDSGAQFQERCSSTALKLFWKKVELNNAKK